MYILKDKKVVHCLSATEWLQWLKTHDRVVAKTTISKEIEVNTVFLGITLSREKAEVFQTMVFGGRFNFFQQRYSSWEEAEQGHNEMVSRVRGSTAKMALYS